MVLLLPLGCAGLALDIADGPQDMKEFKLEKAGSDDDASLCSHDSSELSKEVIGSSCRISRIVSAPCRTVVNLCT